jgi:hypothetical protein
LNMDDYISDKAKKLRLKTRATMDSIYKDVKLTNAH